MKVTKTIAQETAQLMADKRYLPQIKELKQHGGQLIETYFNSLVPKEVLVTYKKYPTFFRTMSSHTMDGTYHRFGRESHFSFENSIPDCENMKKTEEQENEYKLLGDQIFNLLLQVEELKGKRNTLQTNIEEAMLSFSTMKRLQESFPEAYSQIPIKYFKEKVNPPSIPVGDLLWELGYMKKDF